MPTGVILTDCKIVVGGYDLSGFHNSIEMEYGPEMLDNTRFGTNGTRSFEPGLKNFSVRGGGFWDSELDEPLFNKIGAVRDVISLAHEGNVEGDIAYFTRAVSGTYNPLSGEVGALVPFELNFMNANSQLVRGRVLATGSKAASGNSTGVEIGAVGALQRVYSALHVLAVAATSIDVVVESDDAVGFPSPTTRLTHAQFTDGGGIGADWQQLIGPITDTYWRSKWTITGGPFVIFHSVGIL